MSSITTLLASERAELAWVVEIEGYDQAFTTTSDTSGIATAWTTWTQFSAGLEPPSAVTRTIDLMAFRPQPVNVTLRIADLDGTLVALFADDDTSAVTTVLTADADRDDASLTVKDSTGLTSPLYMGHERITSGDSPPVTNCTRGTFPFGGKTTWGHTHRVSTNGQLLGPEVSTKPRVWSGRGVMIYLTAKDPDTGAWVAKANALTWFAGYIHGWTWSGEDRRWSIDVVSIEKRFDSALLRDQFTAVVDGFDIGATVFTVQQMGPAVADNRGTTFTVAAGHYTLDELLKSINDGLETERAAGRLTWFCSMALVSVSAGPRIRTTITIPASLTDGGDYRGTIKVDRSDIQDILGARWAGSRVAIVTGVASGTALQSFTADGGQTPIRARWNLSSATLTVGQITGTWVNQQTDDGVGGGFSGFEGLIQVGDSSSLWIVSWDGTNTFTRIARFDVDGMGDVLDKGAPEDESHAAYVGDKNEVRVRQAWVVEGRVSQHLNRMLLSTGTSGYNDATYDKWPSTVGLGIPSTLVDSVSIEALDSVLGAAGNQRMVVLEPCPAANHINSFCASCGFALVWKNGKLRARIVTTPGALPAEWTLDETNKGNRHAVETDDGGSLIINRFTLKYNRRPVADEYQTEDVYDNLPSQHELDDVREMEYEARNLYDTDGSQVAAWRQNVAAPLAAYFGRAIRRHRRSGSRVLLGIAPGDIVSWSDDDAPNHRTAAYGQSGAKAWVTSVSFDPETCEHDLTLVTPSGKFGAMSPVGLFDYSRGDAGWDSGNLTVYLRAHEFSLSTESVDAAAFSSWVWADTSALFRVVEVDPATPGGAQVWGSKAIVSVDAATNSLVLNGALAGFSTSKRYYIEFEDYATVTAGQQATAYIGDDADQKIVNDDPVYLWQSFMPDVAAATPDGTVGYRRPDSLQDDDGEPMNARKLRDMAHNINNALAHTANQMPISRQFTHATTRTTASATKVLLAGPFLCVCPPGAETLDVTMHVSVSNALGTATFTVTSSPLLPTGSSAQTATFGVDKQSATATSASTGTEKITATLPAMPGADGLSYVTVECSITGGYTASLKGVSASFAARAIA